MAGYFAMRFSKKAARSIKGISVEARQCLTNYDWPGNVRELENAIERAVVLGTTEVIMPEDLPEALLEKQSIAGVQMMNGHSVVLQQQLNGESIASAAASCTHLFVFSANQLVTFDVKTMTPVARVTLGNGGRHSPIIGPFGHVYALTNLLLVFAAPPKLPFQTFGTACDPLLSTTGGSLIK